jgi:predicted nucleotidyltransferase
VESRRPASPRMTLVQRKAAELVALAARYGATRVSLCGSVARGEGVDGSDIDFYVNEFSQPVSRWAGQSGPARSCLPSGAGALQS